MKKKILCLLMTCAMLLTLLPMAAFAVTESPATVSDYDALKTALTNAPTDGTEVTITLDGNITFPDGATELEIAADQKIILNLKGYTIDAAKKDAAKKCVVICMKTGATLTINGDTGTITGGDSGSNAGGGIYNTGTLTIRDCIISGNTASNSHGGGIFAYSGKSLTIGGKTVIRNNHVSSNTWESNLHLQNNTPFTVSTDNPLEADADVRLTTYGYTSADKDISNLFTNAAALTAQQCQYMTVNDHGNSTVYDVAKIAGTVYAKATTDISLDKMDAESGDGFASRSTTTSNKFAVGNTVSVDLEGITNLNTTYYAIPFVNTSLKSDLMLQSSVNAADIANK